MIILFIFIALIIITLERQDRYRPRLEWPPPPEEWLLPPEEWPPPPE
jgi:hypothetical protein